MPNLSTNADFTAAYVVLRAAGFAMCPARVAIAQVWTDDKHSFIDAAMAYDPTFSRRSVDTDWYFGRNRPTNPDYGKTKAKAEWLASAIKAHAIQHLPQGKKVRPWDRIAEMDDTDILLLVEQHGWRSKGVAIKALDHMLDHGMI